MNTDNQTIKILVNDILVAVVPYEELISSDTYGIQLTLNTIEGTIGKYILADVLNDRDLIGVPLNNITIDNNYRLRIIINDKEVKNANT